MGGTTWEGRGFEYIGEGKHRYPNFPTNPLAEYSHTDTLPHPAEELSTGS